jgi:Secretion system C-terminal sorting domain/Domain of unknown function (DUF4832)/PKD domain/Bacterial Ig domain
MGIKFYKARNIYCSRRSIEQAGRTLTILFLIVVASFSGFSQTTALPVSQMSMSTDIVSPGRGAQQWNGSPWDNSNDPYIPGASNTPQEWYSRFLWGTDLEPGAQGSYNFSVFDSRINAAIDAGQLFSFGVMPMCSGCVSGTVTYPAYLHTLMQSESASSQDWYSNVNGSWIPNWNSPNYIARWAALMNALAAHIATGSHAGKNYRDAIGYVDIRGYGETGEWNTYPWYGTEPAGRKATDPSLRAIIDAVANAFPNNQLVICFGSLDPGNACLTPAATSSYVLSKTNAHGHIGWRRDNLGDPGFDGAEDGNAGILTQWQVAPIGGEPNNDASDVPYGDLPREVTKYHMSYFGNGNWASVNASNAPFVANARQASLNAGYRLTINGGNTTTNPILGSAFNITLNWRNIGVAPVYRSYKTQYELRTTAGAVVWTGTSSFKPRLFLPAGTDNVVTDTYTLNGFPAGTYNLYLILRDSAGYTMPLPISITGRNADGSYLLRSNITVGTGSGNQPPVANAGADQTIQLPVSNVSLTGTGTDADGTIASYAWSKLSGPTGGVITTPATAATTITGLIQGVYKYVLTATDNLGAQGLDTVQITVNPAVAVNQPPVANAGANQTIQLPVSTVTLTGTGTDADGTIASYAWTKLSGPTGGTITTPAAAATTITGLIQGVYNYVLTAKDNLGAQGLDTIQITVNPAVAVNQPPVAKAGSDLAITLPTNTVTLDGSASNDPDGSIASFLWTKISGPTQFTIVNNTTASTIVNNLTAGSYSFQLKVTDNAGAIAMDTIKVTVNAAPVNQPPVANAGADINITLPTNVANLNGSASADPDGTIASYAWSQVSGPSTAAIASASAAQSGISGLAQGVYVFALTVTDNSGASKSDSVKVTVNPAANIPPVANAGSSKSITLPISSTVLDGSLSSDPDGSIVTYAWTQTAGPSTATILGGSLVTATASNLVAGQYTFQLSVTDNSGAIATAKVKITVVTAAVQPPVANAGADQTITLPVNSVTIDGSGSSAPSGSITSYAWTEKSGPSSVSLSNTAQNNLTNLKAGVYVFSLIVTDNNAATGSDSVKITVNPAANIPPVSNPGASVSLTLPNNSTTLNGSGSSDPDGTISSYQWAFVSGPSTPTTTGTNTASLSVSGLIAGKYVYRLTVTDNNGASSSALVNIVVTAAGNVPPVANAGTNQSITAPASSAILNGSGSFDPDGSITAYSWITVSGPGSITINNSNTVTPSVIGLQTGIYTFQLTVTDNNGATATDQVFVTVLPQVVLPNQAPVANAGTNLTITSPENSVSLNGTSSFDPDGTITAYAWSQTSGPSAAVISAGNTSSPTVSQLIVGQYTFQLTVTDNNGASNTDQVIITVNPGVSKVDLPPIADAGASDTISLPNNTFMLNASQSTDPDGTITSYQWQQIGGPNTVTSSSMSGPQVSVSGLQAGQYEFQVTVTDNTGATSAATMKLTVEPGTIRGDRLNVFPNPAQSVIHEKIQSSVTGTVKINVYDMNGRLVLTSQTDKSSDTMYETMNVSTLAPGMYTIQINIANRKTMVTKFIKN